MTGGDEVRGAHGGSDTGARGSGEARGAPGELRARVTVHRGSFDLHVEVAARSGEVLAVLGPNGAGKSTLLSVLAGLIAPAEGTVRLGDRVLTDGSRVVPAEDRRVGLMGQDPKLFPHLTALDNIAFGPRSQGRSRRRSAAIASEWLGRMDLAEFGTRRPAGLSGGQRQRVALARALAAGPELLLLDEPLGALDASTAPEIRHILRRHIRDSGTTTIVVTHDVLDAATLADRVLVLDGGAVIDEGPTAQVLSAPRSAFSATLAGLNMVTGVTAGCAHADEAVTVSCDGTAVSGIASDEVGEGATVAAVFPPSAVAVFLAPPAAGSPRNAWWADVVALEPGPSAIRVRARVGAETGPMIAADLTPAAVAELGLAPGSRVLLSVKATEVRIHRR